MAWYRAGSVAVTNGSAVVTSSGTAWVNNVQIGHAINLPDGRAYEVLSVDSNTQITLGSPYLGGTASGQPYSVQPNQGFAQTAATRLSDFLTQISGWVSGALAGRFGDGSTAAPGVSFAADQDTGWRRLGENAVSLVTGGVDRLASTASGDILVSATAPVFAPNGRCLEIKDPTAAAARLLLHVATIRILSVEADSGGNLTFWDRSTGVERARLDSSGNLLVGTTSAPGHTLAKQVATGGLVLDVAASNGSAVAIYGAAGGGSNGLATVMRVGYNTNGRSISTGGTINASGADYAEYMLKSAGCGIIDKGDICGVDRDGKLTKTWADSISFVVKSTDPSLVGGDTWGAHLAPRPTEPGTAPFEPKAPVYPTDPGDEAAMGAYRAAADGYPAQVAAYQKALVEWQAASDTYEAALTEWEGAMETTRKCVDRIAFCGQVPCNVTGDFEVGDYIVAVASGAGIKAIEVKPDDITLAQYMRRIGKVWAIRDGRAWIDVQHG